jgi:hypothetical protein
MLEDGGVNFLRLAKVAANVIFCAGIYCSLSLLLIKYYGNYRVAGTCLFYNFESDTARGADNNNE